MENLRRRHDCRLCGSSDVDLAMAFEPCPIVDQFVTPAQLDTPQPSFPLDWFLCNTCGHFQQLSIVDEDVLYGDYIYRTASSPGLDEHFRKYADTVSGYFDDSSGELVVDLGSNDGTLLSEFKRNGFDVLGVDPAGAIAEAATAAGIPTLTGFFDSDVADQVLEKSGKASLVTINNLLANVDDVGPFIAAVHKLLKPDGVLVFESFYLCDTVDNLVFDFLYHEHLSAFSVIPVQRFLKEHGFELFDVERVPTKGGSVRYFAQLAGGERSIDQSVGTLIKEEQAAGTTDMEYFARFADVVEKSKKDTVAYLKGLDSSKTIVGYGASASCTMLTAHFGFGDRLHSLVDDNPDKQGTFSPGLHIPVRKSDDLYEMSPDVILILAWRFAPMIMERHRRFMDEGGTFVTMLPELTIHRAGNAG